MREEAGGPEAGGGGRAAGRPEAGGQQAQHSPRRQRDRGEIFSSTILFHQLCSPTERSRRNFFIDYPFS